MEDSLYEWNVKIFKVDEDSLLAGDLKELQSKTGKDHIALQFLFNDSFPFAPPFVRVLYPVIFNGYVMRGGALCMELLTPQGWSSAYSMDSVILQISATMANGKGRIQFKENLDQYNLEHARKSFQRAVDIHAKAGWKTKPENEGWLDDWIKSLPFEMK